MEIDPPFDIATLGLKEIGNLASWTVSSCKPGCGVEALRDEDTSLFWQYVFSILTSSPQYQLCLVCETSPDKFSRSDGPQPHHLNIHFSRLVSILSIRIYLDFEADESYTPTRITLLAGTGYHDLLPFSALEFAQPKGWIDVPLDHVGGGPDGKTLRAFIVQVKIVENHQNGKDTHVRGLKIYARDERSKKGVGLGEGMGLSERTDDGNANGRGKRMAHLADEKTWIVEPDWMGEPELR
jgi:anaphase-promoting complex subunit 10